MISHTHIQIKQIRGNKSYDHFSRPNVMDLEKFLTQWKKEITLKQDLDDFLIQWRNDINGKQNGVSPEELKVRRNRKEKTINKNPLHTHQK